MKRLKLLIGMLLTAAIALSVGMSTLSAFADTQAIEDAPAISLEEDFDGTSVLVTMTEEISEVNKVYDKSFFGDIEISSIEDLSTITGNIAEKEYFDESKFKQILQLHLPIDSEENVLDCKNIAYKYSKITNCKRELEIIKNYWKEQLRKTTSIYSNRIY